MAIKFNPLTGNFDFTGSGGGGGASYIDGEVAVYADLPLDGTAALNTAWLVRTASGVWPVSRKQAGIYIRTATGGSNRDADYTYAGTMPDVFSDSQFLLYDNTDTSKNLAFDLGSISTGTTRTLTAPDSSGTISLIGHTHAASDIWDLQDYLSTIVNDGGPLIGSASELYDQTNYKTGLRVIDGDLILYGALYTASFVQQNFNASRIYNLPNVSGTIALTTTPPASHTHGNITNGGLVGTTSGLPLKTGTGGIVEAGAFGTSAGQFAEGNHTHSAATTSVAGFLSTADKTKLDGVATGATANSTDATLLARANHTGTQASSTITQATARILGRTTASTGAVEELTVGNGLTLASGSLAATSIPAKVEVFTANDTWTKPAGAKMVHYILVGGGGGGGGGRRSDASTAAFGGGGGAGAGVSIGWLNADFLGSTETVTIGAGGSGGGARTTADTNGQSGTAGNNTSFGSYLEARGGTLGSGGTTTAGTRGASSTARGAFYGGTQDSSAGGGAGSAETTGGTGENRMSMPSGGGGGAGKSAAGAYGTGGASAGVGLQGTGSRTGITATANAAGTAGTGFFYYGLGGSGGSANSSTGAANKGGDGGPYGAGGGGGSGSLNAAGGDNSGGAGAQGVAVITTYF